MSDRADRYRPRREKRPGASRALTVARFLLCLAQPLTFTVLFASMSACILPLAPEFQDPPAAQNYPPVITDADPAIGSVTMAKTFTLLVRDANLNDNLYVRWEADYPPLTPNTRSLNGSGTIYPHPTDVSPVEVAVPVDCTADNLATNISQHQVMAIIADRPFIAGMNLDQTEPGGFVVKATWLLNLECMTPP
jgi:hypothetical protein